MKTDSCKLQRNIMWAYLVKSMKHSIYKAWFYRPLTFLEELRRIKAVTFIADYSGTRFVQTRIPQNGVFLEHTVFPLHNSSLFIFVKQTRRVNTDSSNCSPLFTNKNPQFMRNKTNFGRVDQNLMFVSL